MSTRVSKFILYLSRPYVTSNCHRFFIFCSICGNQWLLPELSSPLIRFRHSRGLVGLNFLGNAHFRYANGFCPCSKPRRNTISQAERQSPRMQRAWPVHCVVCSGSDWFLPAATCHDRAQLAK
jgi:hypothetical protein